MNLLARARLSSHLILRSPSPGKCAFPFHPGTVAAFERCNFFATKSTYSSQKTQQLTKPRTQKSSESSSKFSFSQRVKEQTQALATVWPKPREIPYQEKVANFVNLIGYVKTPVQFEATSDGMHLACVVISQGNGGERNSLLIPVVFEGDLAHVVACHVKENDCVFVSGQLSVEPMRLALSESLGKFHVVAENLNFVEGLQRIVSDKIGRPFSATEIDRPIKALDKKIEEVLEKDNNDGEFDRQWKDALEHVKAKRASGIPLEDSVEKKVGVEVEAVTTTFKHGSEESREGKVSEKSGGGVGKKKDGDATLDLWRDLVKNPLQWWDYREYKSNGLVKEKHPDFKQKETNEPLWINSAPAWVLPGLGKLEFDVKVLKGMQGQGSGGLGEKRKDAQREDSWKDLVENPSKWWDNRTGKRNQKAPDFKHKETGEVLWVSSSPNWVLSKLPPPKDGGSSDVKKF